MRASSPLPSPCGEWPFRVPHDNVPSRFIGPLPQLHRNKEKSRLTIQTLTFNLTQAKTSRTHVAWTTSIIKRKGDPVLAEMGWRPDTLLWCLCGSCSFPSGALFVEYVHVCEMNVVAAEQQHCSYPDKWRDQRERRGTWVTSHPWSPSGQQLVVHLKCSFNQRTSHSALC